MEQRTLRLNMDLSFVYGPRTWRAPLVAVMLLAAVGDLNSESVTLSTYYPAPSGVYTNMITTGDTRLARDGGSVGIRTGAAALVASQALTVNGNANVTGFFGAMVPVPTQALDVAGSVKVAKGGCTAANANNGSCGGQYITWAPGVYVEGSWSTGPGIRIMPAPPGESNGIILGAPTYYCCPK